MASTQTGIKRSIAGPDQIADGMFHMHYPIEVSQFAVLHEMPRLLDICRSYNVKTMMVDVPASCKGVAKELQRYSFAVTGVHAIMNEGLDTKRAREWGETYKFIKIRNIGFMSQPPSNVKLVEGIIEAGIKGGITLYAIHTEELTKEFVSTLQRFAERDIYFNLIHGVDALHQMKFSAEPRKELVGDVKALERHVILGASSFDKMYLVPNEKLISAIDLGLGNMVSFESDFSLNDKDSWYSSVIDTAKRSIGVNAQVFHENLEGLLRRAGIR